MERIIRRALTVALALVLGLIGGAAAGGRAAAPDPLLRIVHASSDAPAIDVYVNGQKVTTAPQFASVTPYTVVPPGPASVQVLAAGAGTGGRTFLTTNIDLTPGLAYTIVAADRAGQMSPVVLVDTLDQAMDGQAHVRLVHVSPDAPPVADVAIAGGPVIARNLSFKGATGYLTVAPGSYAFEIRPAGTVQALATTPTLTLEANRSYSAFVMGQLGDNTFRAVITVDNAVNGGIGGVPSTGGGGMALIASAPGASVPGPSVPVASFLAAAIAAVLLVMRRAWMWRAASAVRRGSANAGRTAER